MKSLPLDLHRPAWAEIDLDALAGNLLALRGRLGAARILAVVKADAYGHGAVPVSRRLEREGVDWLGVAIPEEGVEIRLAGVRTPILIMGGFSPAQAALLLSHDLTPAVFRPDHVEALSAEAVRRRTTARLHVKIDTGMGRLGVPADQVTAFARLLKDAPGLEVTGAFSHLAVADEPDDPFTAQQLNQFLGSVATLRAAGLRPADLHLANSPAVVGHRSTWLTLARPGLLLYGYNPGTHPAPLAVRPVLSVRARIVLIKDLPAGASVGYGRAWKAPEPSRIATLAIGYADGLPRSAGPRASVLIRGRRAPVVGRISMDLTTVDVSAIPDAALGDVATVLGADGGDRLGADSLAAAASTITWEILSRIGVRMPRLFSDTGASFLETRFVAPNLD